MKTKEKKANEEAVIAVRQLRRQNYIYSLKGKMKTETTSDTQWFEKVIDFDKISRLSKDNIRSVMLRMKKDFGKAFKKLGEYKQK